MESGMERNIRLGALLDHYGPFLTPRQRKLLSLHVDEDLSLGEIAEMEGVSRQAVHDALRRGALQLEEMEARLRLLSRTEAVRRAEARLDELESMILGLPPEQRENLLRETAALRDIWEEINGV